MTWRSRCGAGAVLALIAGGLFPTEAGAHGLVGRADLPVPSWLFGWAAAIVLVVSFVALATLWPKPQLQEPVYRPLFRIPSIVDVLAGLTGVGLFVLVVYSGFAGAQQATVNLA